MNCNLQPRNRVSVWPAVDTAVVVGGRRWAGRRGQARERTTSRGKGGASLPPGSSAHPFEWTRGHLSCTDSGSHAHRPPERPGQLQVEPGSDSVYVTKVIPWSSFPSVWVWH